MAESGSYPSEIKTTRDLLQNLEFYLMCCSVQMDADALSVVAGTLANGGVYVVANEAPPCSTCLVCMRPLSLCSLQIV